MKGYWQIFLVGMLAAGCKKVVTLDLRSVPPEIVIEGNVINDTGPYQVLLSRAVNFSVSNSFPPVSGATVRITDSTDGLTEQLQEVGAGIYQTQHIIGKPLHTYQLAVIADGIEYTASSTMPRPVELDSVTLAVNINIANQQGINAVANFEDPKGVSNYYQFSEVLNSRVLPNVFVFEDRLSDGRYIREALYNDSNYLQKGDTLVVTMSCVDANVYNYFLVLSGITSNNGNGPLLTTPANPVTNISNGALGYFSAHTVESELLVVYH